MNKRKLSLLDDARGKLHPTAISWYLGENGVIFGSPVRILNMTSAISPEIHEEKNEKGKMVAVLTVSMPTGFRESMSCTFHMHPNVSLAARLNAGSELTLRVGLLLWAIREEMGETRTPITPERWLELWRSGDYEDEEWGECSS